MSPRDLRCLRPGPIDEFTSSIIIVPDVGDNLPTAATQRQTGPWAWAFKDEGRTQRAVFDYAVDDSSSLADLIVRLGDELAEGIISNVHSWSSACGLPHILVGHGFGGLIIKRAMTLLSERRVLYRTGCLGIVFLGAPHPTFKNAAQWGRLPQIVRCSAGPSKYPDEFLERLEVEAGTLANLARRFEEAGLDAPVFSVFESQESKIPRRWLGTSHRQMLVDFELAQTSVRSEVMIKSPTDHRGVVDIRQTPGLVEKISELLTKGQSGLKITPIGSILATSFRKTDKDSGSDTESEEGFDPALELGPSPPPDLFLFESNAYESNVFAAFASTVASSATTPTRSFYTPRSRPTPGSGSASYARRQTAIRLPCHRLDPSKLPRPRLVGRRDVMLRLDDELLPSNAVTTPVTATYTSAWRKTLIVALWGPEGAGKTAIAAEFANRRKSHYDAVFWVPASSPAQLRAAYHGAAHQLGLLKNAGTSHSDDDADHVVCRSKLLRWLNQPLPPHRSFPPRWLIVFDDVRHMADVSDFWPGDAGGGSILITSRDPEGKLLEGWAGWRIQRVEVEALGTIEEEEPAHRQNRHQPNDRDDEATLRPGRLPVVSRGFGASATPRGRENLATPRRWYDYGTPWRWDAVAASRELFFEGGSHQHKHPEETAGTG